MKNQSLVISKTTCILDPKIQSNFRKFSKIDYSAERIQQDPYLKILLNLDQKGNVQKEDAEFRVIFSQLFELYLQGKYGLFLE